MVLKSCFKSSLLDFRHLSVCSLEMVDFIADTEDLTEFVDQNVINNKEEEEEVIKEAFFSSKNGHMLHTRQKWISIAEAHQFFQDQDCDERLHALAPICYFSTAEVIPLNDTTFWLVLCIMEALEKKGKSPKPVIPPSVHLGIQMSLWSTKIYDFI